MLQGVFKKVKPLRYVKDLYHLGTIPFNALSDSCVRQGNQSTKANLSLLALINSPHPEVA